MNNTDDDNADPLRVKAGAYFACLDSGYFVTGENPLRLLAQHLISRGEEPSRRLEVHRGALVSKSTVGRAAGMRCHE